MRTSWASTPAVRQSMLANRSRDTRPELAVRRLLHQRGFRYRVAARPLPEVRRTADVVFTRVKVAVFIDGCFWHGCPTHYSAPKGNIEFWQWKVDLNRGRDVQVDRLLVARGWKVVRIWEHEDPAKAVDRIQRAVLARTGALEDKLGHPRRIAVSPRAEHSRRSSGAAPSRAPSTEPPGRSGPLAGTKGRTRPRSRLR
jgi:DNA mismatch endonuclease, patch repair protein